MPTDNSPDYGYLTPDAFTPVDYICGRLRIPNNQLFLAAFMGALTDLTEAESWEAFGTMTPEDAAYLALQVVNDFTMHRGMCMIGTIVAIATTDPPNGTLLCDGSTYDRVDYPDLYSVLLPAYQVDADHFTTPDLRGQTLIGAPFTVGATTYNAGDMLGEYEHTLTVGEMPSHSHDNLPHDHAESGAVSSVAAPPVPPAIVPSAIATPLVTAPAIITISNTGGDAPHNNVQPSTALQYAIVAL